MLIKAFGSFFITWHLDELSFKTFICISVFLSLGNGYWKLTCVDSETWKNNIIFYFTNIAVPFEHILPKFLRNSALKLMPDHNDIGILYHPRILIRFRDFLELLIISPKFSVGIHGVSLLS